MKKLRVLLGLCTVLAIAAPAVPAGADPHAGPPICPSAGPALSGTHYNLIVKGNAYVKKGTTLKVTHDLTIAPKACFDAFTLGTVTVGGNVLVKQGAVFALGCTPNSIGPVPPCGHTTTHDVVGGSITADQALTMYLDGDTVHGDIVSIGGGPGATLNPYINFPIKDNTIGGNLVVQGWKGAWAGALRDHVKGSLQWYDNVGLATSESHAPDSNEIATNVVGQDLICRNNSPAAQLGDSGGSKNVVGGQKLGECTKV